MVAPTLIDSLTGRMRATNKKICLQERLTPIDFSYFRNFGMRSACFSCCKFCLWVRRHKWRAFCFSNLLFGRPLFQLYCVNKILVQDSYVCLIFSLLTRCAITLPLSLSLSASHSPDCLCLHIAISAHVQFVYMCASNLFNCYHLWRFCRALSFVFVDLMLPSIYLIKTERQRCRRHVSCAFFCSVMLA